MKALLKNLNIGGLLVLLAGVVLTVSWKSSDISAVAGTGWYGITVDPLDQDNPSSQEINGFVDTAPPTGSCSVNNEEKPCQVHLDLTNFSSTTPIEDMTVQQALAAGASITNGGTSSPDGYAREEE